MSSSTPTEPEKAAIETIHAVTHAASYKHLEPAGGPTPDWELTLGDGSVAYVEVTECVDAPVRELFGITHKDGSAKRFGSGKLAYEWGVAIVDRDPAFNKEQSPLKNVVKKVVEILSKTEEIGGTPEQMKRNASVLFEGGVVASRDPEDMLTLTHSVGLRIQDGRRSQFAAVGDLTPKWVGPGDGWVGIATLTARPVGRLGELVSDVQNAIDNKTKKRQMGNCSEPKWLVVMVNACELKDRYGEGSRCGDRMQYPAPKGIRFDYFDEVWVCSLSGAVVWRLLKGETQMTVYHL